MQEILKTPVMLSRSSTPNAALLLPDGDPKDILMVANRGEIAIRILRAAADKGIRTISIYSQQDRLSMHRYKAHESFMIGGTGNSLTPIGAYLDIDEIMKIAVERNVTMIHPGYGFLSENAKFAKSVEDAGIKFIGPTPEVIDMLGDKTKARTIAIKAGVSVVPGSDGPIENLEQAKAFTETHGFPIIIKAALGGGGRGMRVVLDDESLGPMFLRAKSEAASSFGILFIPLIFYR
jgi:pyruvate carboxylase